jgi:hypothetical protein
MMFRDSVARMQRSEIRETSATCEDHPGIRCASSGLPVTLGDSVQRVARMPRSEIPAWTSTRTVQVCQRLSPTNLISFCNAASSPTASCACAAMAARRRNWWPSPASGAASAPRALVRKAAHGRGRRPPGRLCHPQGAGAPVGVVVSDTLAQPVRRASRIARAGIADHPSGDRHVPVQTDRPEARSSRHRCCHAHPALRLSREPEHSSACAGARWGISERHRK